MTRGQIYESEVLGIRIVLEKKGEEVIGSVEYPSNLDQFASAVHIHKNVGGTPGPILSWLCTSKEWESGVLQNTPGKNYPFCAVHGCSLNAPPGTPYVSESCGIKRAFQLDKQSLKVCNGNPEQILSHFANNFLVVHGKRFQRIKGNCLTNGKPGLDILGIGRLSKLT